MTRGQRKTELDPEREQHLLLALPNIPLATCRLSLLEAATLNYHLAARGFATWRWVQPDWKPCLRAI